MRMQNIKYEVHKQKFDNQALLHTHHTHTHIQTPNPVKCDYSQFKRMNIEKGEEKNKGKRNGLKLCVNEWIFVSIIIRLHFGIHCFGNKYVDSAK